MATSAAAVPQADADAADTQAAAPPTPRLLGGAVCTYTSCYCEENVYKLCTRLLAEPGLLEWPPMATSSAAPPPPGTVSACFVSNPQQSVPLWEQRAGDAEEDGFVVWDYHVIVIAHVPGSEALVYDLDTRLDFPCSLAAYADRALRSSSPPLLARFARLYRLVPADNFVRDFASDRSHMRRPDGSWIAPPPTYPPIVNAAGATMNLDAYRLINESKGAAGPGEVLSERQLLARFLGPGPS